MTSRPYVIYNPATGDILRTGTAPESAWALQALEGEAIIEAMADSRTQRVDLSTQEVVPK